MKAKPMTKQELTVVLADMLSSVVQDDTLEGTITYACPNREEPDCDFMVSGSYRVGNREGQGGVHIIGDLDGGEGLGVVPQ